MRRIQASSLRNCNKECTSMGQVRAPSCCLEAENARKLGILRLRNAAKLIT
jgi:hypothetical protein